MENYGGVFIKARRVGQTYANQVRGKEANHIFFEEAGSFSSLSDYAKMHNSYKYTFPALRKGGRLYNLSGIQQVIYPEYHRYYNKVEELSLEEQVYIKEGRVVSEGGPRRSGRTTKIIENAIQDMIENGEAIIMDHHPHSHEHTWKWFQREMHRLYPHTQYEIEEGTRDKPRKVFVIST